jgi:hypothetical protein
MGGHKKSIMKNNKSRESQFFGDEIMKPSSVKL